MNPFKLSVVFALMIVSSEMPAAEPKHIVLVNAAGIEKDMVDAVLNYAERELEIPVHARTNVALKATDSLLEMGRQIGGSKSAGEGCVIALVKARAEEARHAVIMTNECVVVLNITALQSEDNVKFTRRLQRWVLRGTAFLLGVGPDVDPHCVMIDYNTVDELDRLGMNFSPPWGVMVQEAAVKRGFEIRPAQ